MSIDAAPQDTSSQRSHNTHVVRRPVHSVPTAGEAVGVRHYGAAAHASVQRRSSDALVDRWRPETHTFHLPSGELMVTLEDVTMILDLLIRGQAVTSNTSFGNWRARVVQYLGVEPPEAPDGQRLTKTSGVPLSWLHAKTSHSALLTLTRRRFSGTTGHMYCTYSVVSFSLTLEEIWLPRCGCHY